MKIVQMLIPQSNKFTRPGIAMNPAWITIHETGNTTKGADALAHTRLQQRGNSRQASWHFSVDDGDVIYQSIPTNEVGFHAGDGSGDGNRKSIGIEICVNEDGDFEKAKANAVWLVRYLMGKYNIPIARVVPHKHWSGKNCPHNILKSGWDKFIAQVNGEAPSAPSKPHNSYPGKYIRYSSRGSVVKQIQKELGGLVVDGIFGLRTQERVKEFQRAHNLVADGIVGINTWNALFN